MSVLFNSLLIHTLSYRPPYTPIAGAMAASHCHSAAMEHAFNIMGLMRSSVHLSAHADAINTYNGF